MQLSVHEFYQNCHSKVCINTALHYVAYTLNWRIESTSCGIFVELTQVWHITNTALCMSRFDASHTLHFVWVSLYKSSVAATCIDVLQVDDFFPGQRKKHNYAESINITNRIAYNEVYPRCHKVRVQFKTLVTR